MRQANATVSQEEIIANMRGTEHSVRRGNLDADRRAQRSMVRQMVGIRRRSHEAWVEYIQRATHTRTSIAEQSGVQDWVSFF